MWADYDTRGGVYASASVDDDLECLVYIVSDSEPKRVYSTVNLDNDTTMLWVKKAMRFAV